MLLQLVGVALLVGSLGIHQVNEGHIGVYWRGGALLPTTTQPGFQWRLPLITSYAEVQISVQTDRVTNIPCGTSGGVVIVFDSIEVVNRLRPSSALDTVRKYTVSYDKIWIFDKIHHEINQFCSSHTLQEVYIDLFDSLDENLASALQRDCDKWETGIEIIATRVTKPRIPAAIQNNYDQMEAEKTRLLISIQRQKVIEKEAETQRMQAMIEAEQHADVSRIMSQIQMLEQKGLQRMQGIADAMHLTRARTHADGMMYRQSRVAEANQLKLTRAFLQWQALQRLKTTTKSFYGSSLEAALNITSVENFLDSVVTV